jgi:hypothetical protein
MLTTYNLPNICLQSVDCPANYMFCDYLEFFDLTGCAEDIATRVAKRLEIAPKEV